MYLRGKKGQIAIFVIIALIIVGGIVTFFLLRGNLSVSGVPAEFAPVYDQYQSCISEETKAAVDLAGSQGGYIYLPEYIPGSNHAPSSSQLNFLGFAVPYWYYVSGNGLIKEQVPLKADIEKQIGKYVSDRLANCDFEKYYTQGFIISLSNQSSVVATVSDAKINVVVSSALKVSKGDTSAVKNDYSVDVSSKFGKFYNMAIGIYNKEKSEAFLENYSADVLRNYAPVDGVEIGCAPKIWKSREVVDTLKNGLAANVAALKFKGNYYTSTEKNKYFVIDYPVDESMNLIYSTDWPTKVEIAGANGELMTAEPIGNQQGLGVMGFCYSPYHFVYDVSFPILLQIYDNQELFQFPVISVINNNMARNGIPSEINYTEPDFDLCQIKDHDVSVKTYDVQLNPVESDISFSCLGQECSLGKTKNGQLTASAPSCTNGYLIARAEGYAERQQLFSSNEELLSEIILDKEYDVNVTLLVDGKPLVGNAVATFSGERSASVAWPGNLDIKLSEGSYNVSVYVYSNTSIPIPADSKTQCQEVVASGILGLFGGTKEQCYEINSPATKIESAIIGGGKADAYLLPVDLERGNIILRVDSLPVPKTLNELQENYLKFDNLGVEVG